MRTEITNEAAKAAPPVMVYVYSWLHDLTINSVVGYLTAGYLILQAAHLLWKWRREARK
jgi:hypothetical protein